MLELKRLTHERVGLQVNLTDGEVVGCLPIAVQGLEGIGCEWAFLHGTGFRAFGGLRDSSRDAGIEVGHMGSSMPTPKTDGWISVLVGLDVPSLLRVDRHPLTLSASRFGYV